jgi:cation transport ATPase
MENFLDKIATLSLLSMLTGLFFVLFAKFFHDVDAYSFEQAKEIAKIGLIIASPGILIISSMIAYAFWIRR